MGHHSFKFQERLLVFERPEPLFGLRLNPIILRHPNELPRHDPKNPYSRNNAGSSQEKQTLREKGPKERAGVANARDVQRTRRGQQPFDTGIRKRRVRGGEIWVFLQDY